MSDNTNQAFDMGYAACMAGIAKEDNPYGAATEEEFDWNQGWDSCHDDVENPKPNSFKTLLVHSRTQTLPTLPDWIVPIHVTDGIDRIRGRRIAHVIYWNANPEDLSKPVRLAISTAQLSWCQAYGYWKALTVYDLDTSSSEFMKMRPNVSTTSD